jgi:hypothetical protein
MTLEELSRMLEGMGCPQAKSLQMASQLDKRARQGRSYEGALTHLLRLMKQGWAAREQGH